MNCKICKSNSSNILKKVYRCDKCQHIYRELNIDPDFYKSGEYRKSHIYQSTVKRQLWINNIIDFIKDYMYNIKSVFEVGAGDGLFLATIKKQYNKKVSSCEIDETLKYSWINYYEDFAKLQIDFVDLIVAIDVIEHFQNTDDFLNSVNSKFLLLQVPINREITSPDISTDTHYHYFSDISIKLMCEKYGFLLKKILKTGRNFSANGPEMLCLFEK